MIPWMICHSRESGSGWAANQMRSGIGADTTQWRSGARGMRQSTRQAFVCASA